MTSKRNDAHRYTGVHDMTKRNTKTNNVEIASIVLKTIHNDIMNNNANCTLTTKIMRTWLRVNMRDAHTHNASWVFTTSQTHDIRMKFDAKYRATNERNAKRDAQSNVTPRVRKSRVVATIDDANASNVDVVANVDENVIA